MYGVRNAILKYFIAVFFILNCVDCLYGTKNSIKKEWGIVGTEIFERTVLKNKKLSSRANEDLTVIDDLYEEVREYIDNLMLHVNVKYAERKRLKKEAKARKKALKALREQEVDDEEEDIADPDGVEDAGDSDDAEGDDVQDEVEEAGFQNEMEDVCDPEDAEETVDQDDVEDAGVQDEMENAGVQDEMNDESSTNVNESIEVDTAASSTPPVTNTANRINDSRKGAIDMDEEQQRLVDDLFGDEDNDNQDAKASANAEQSVPELEEQGPENVNDNAGSTEDDADKERKQEEQQGNAAEESNEQEADELDTKESQNSDVGKSEIGEGRQDSEELEPNAGEIVSEDGEQEAGELDAKESQDSDRNASEISVEDQDSEELDPSADEIVPGKKRREIRRLETEESQDDDEDYQEDYQVDVGDDDNDLQYIEDDSNGIKILKESGEEGVEIDDDSLGTDIDEDDSDNRIIEDQSKNNEVYEIDDDERIEEELEDPAEDAVRNDDLIEEEGGTELLQEDDFGVGEESVEDVGNNTVLNAKARVKSRKSNMKQRAISQKSETSDFQTSFLDEPVFQEGDIRQGSLHVKELGDDFLTYHQMVNKYNYQDRISNNEKVSQFAENGNKDSDLTQTYNEVRVTNLAKDPEWLKKYDQWKSNFNGESNKKEEDRINAVDF